MNQPLIRRESTRSSFHRSLHAERSRVDLRLGRVVPEHGFDEKLPSLVRASHQRPTGHVPEPDHLLAVHLPLVKLLRSDVLHDVEVRRRGAEVLPQREDVHAGFFTVPHRRGNLIIRLAQPEHDARLGDQAFRPRRFGVPQDVQRLLVPSARVPDALL